MKKSLKGLLIALVLMIPIFINAATFSPAMDCPASANPNDTVSCKITATIDDTITGIQGKIDNLGSLTFVSFDKGVSDLDVSTFNSSGFIIGQVDGLAAKIGSTKITIGTLKVKLPENASGSYGVTLKDLKANYKDGDEDKKVTANNITKTIKVKSKDSSLKDLSVDGLTLGPGFQSTIYNYTLPETDRDSIKINATPNDSGASVSGAGTVSLKYGENTFTITVTSESGDTTKYTIKITRTDTRDTVNTLKSLEVKDYTITPTFSATTKTYSLTVEPTVTKVEIKAERTSDKSSFTKNFGPRTVNLNYGKNAIQIKVKAENEKENVYTINITRTDNRDSNNFLKTLTISNGNIVFDKKTTSYVVNVDSSVTEVTVSAEAESDKAKVKGTGTKKLKEGNNKIEIVVTAENETTKKYTITVNRGKTAAVVPEENKTTEDNGTTTTPEEPKKTYITSLIIRNSEIDFDPNIFNYDVKLGANDDKLDFLYQTGEGYSAEVSGNENLEDGSVVKITVDTGDETVEYVFTIKKEAVIAEAEAGFNNIIFYVAAGLLGLVVFGLLLAAFTKKKPTPEEVVQEKFVQEEPKNFYNNTTLVDGVSRDQVSSSMVSQVQVQSSMSDAVPTYSAPATIDAPEVEPMEPTPVEPAPVEPTPIMQPEPQPMVQAPAPIETPAMDAPAEMEPMAIGGPIVNEVPGDFTPEQNVSLDSPSMTPDNQSFQMSQPSGLNSTYATDVPDFEPVNQNNNY